MKLLLAMAGLLQKQYGVRVWQHTPVQAIERDEEEGTAAGAAQAQPRWLVRTARGSIRARAVVHATNAWVSDLLPRLRGLVTPVRNHVIQTTPIRAHLPTVAPEDPSPDLASVSTAPSPPPPSYLSRSPNFAHDASSSSCGALWDGLSFGWHEGYDYMQQRRDGRVILGGHRYLAPKMDTEQGDSAAPLLPHVLHSLCGLLPRTFAPLFDAKGPNTNVQVSHAWAGIMGFTSTCDPVIGGAPSASSDNAPTSLKGQFVAVGFSGHGMPRCHPAGRQLAAQVEAYLRTGQWQAADLSTLQPQLRTQPSEELLRTLGITSEQLTALLQQAQARTLTARL
jgi:glycine/D-amino acid oxidase-like deaminating enzyme